MTNHTCRLCGKPTSTRVLSAYQSLIRTHQYRCSEHEDTDILRSVRFAPYLKGKGPTFQLITWDGRRYHRNGPQWLIGYRLTMRENDITTTLFCGEDYGCSPMYAIDSNECIKSLMSFLTLRPGDTDSEYFASYTPAQLDFCNKHAEALECCVNDKYGWED